MIVKPPESHKTRQSLDPFLRASVVREPQDHGQQPWREWDPDVNNWLLCSWRFLGVKSSVCSLSWECLTSVFENSFRSRHFKKMIKLTMGHPCIVLYFEMYWMLCAFNFLFSVIIYRLTEPARLQFWNTPVVATCGSWGQQSASGDQNLICTLKEFPISLCVTLGEQIVASSQANSGG